MGGEAGRRNRQMFGPQTGDRCAPEPTPTEILFSGVERTEQTACTAVVRRGLGWWRCTRAANKGNRKKINAVHFTVPDLWAQVRASGHAARLRIVCRDATEAHIWITFASPRTALSLCIGPLALDVDVFFDRAVADDHSTSVYVSPLERS
jgi:hypothetical protein